MSHHKHAVVNKFKLLHFINTFLKKGVTNIYNLNYHKTCRWPSLDGAWRQNFFAASTMLPDCYLLL